MEISNSHRQYPVIFIVTVLALSLVPHAGHACDANISPDSLLSNLSTRMINEINADIEAIRNDPTVATILIEQVLEAHVDFVLASRKVLVFEWEKLNAQQKSRFIDAFKIFLIRHASVLLTDFLAEQNQKLKANPIQFEKEDVASDKIARVKSKVYATTGETYDVGYRLYCRGSAWKIYDVEINGVSTVNVYKEQFKLKIDRDGFDSLITFLNYRNDVLLAYNRD